MTETIPQPSSIGRTIVVSNTGPLISAFQSDSFGLLDHIFERIYISGACQAEFIKLGWQAHLEKALPKIVVLQLDGEEQKRARSIAQQIAKQSAPISPTAEGHLGEAQVIVLMERAEFRDDLLLLDDSAARDFAKQIDLRVTGFAGVLLLAVQAKLISALELKKRMEKCRLAGTHYSVNLINQVHTVALETE